jgi:hypothetical protein
MIAVSASAATTDEAGLRRQATELGEACAAAGVELGLGGSGPWPDPPPNGQRFRTIAAFVARARLVAEAAESGRD